MNMRNMKYGNDKLSDKKIEFWRNKWINFNSRYAPFIHRGAVTVSISRIRRKTDQ
jgi:hypothetical protein